MQKPDPQPQVQTKRLGRLIEKMSAQDPVLGRLSTAVKIYCVGGAVRDALLGIDDADQDFVVVGSSPDEMAAAGFTPVGKDFPVFLHPVSHDEYALARTERKSGKGYKGFVFNADPTVRLEDDLSRRDLTINAIALGRNGDLIDPYHGVNDLESRILRHVGPAFSEDPVRLLRLARFAARWPDFTVADETFRLCNEIVARGEAKALVPERVWQEIAKGLTEPKPSRLVTLLSDCGAWQELHPEIHSVSDETLQAIDLAASQHMPTESIYALLIHNQGGAIQTTELFKAPRPCIDLAALLIGQSAAIPGLVAGLHDNPVQHAEKLLDWLAACDLHRRPDRYRLLLSCLYIEKRISQSDMALLSELADWISRPDANAQVARAAQECQQSTTPIEQAVRSARLAALISHPLFR